MENNKYVVKVANVFANYIEVEAPDEAGAKLAAKEKITKDDLVNSFKHYYEATIPEEHWGVITKEEFDRLQEEQRIEQEKESDNKL
jgi:hypothetical protein